MLRQCRSWSFDEKLFCAALPTTTKGDEEMEKDLSKESVRHLLEHWIEHNQSHSTSFRERAAQVASVSEKAAQDINQAAELMDQCTEMLRKAMQDL